MKHSHLLCAAAMLAGSAAINTAPAARSDDTAAFQYEVRPGSRKPVSTFYLAFQSGGQSRIHAGETDHESSVRLPVYSTDPDLPTTFSRISLLTRAADDQGRTGGDILSSVLGFTLYVVLPAYAVGKRMHEAFDMGLDISGIEIPDISESLPPETTNENQ